MEGRAVLILGVFMMFSTQAAATFTWEPCDADAAPFTSSEVLLAPDPPVIGNQVTFTIKGNADRDVPVGAISMSVSYLGTPIYEGSDDLCTKTACPIKPGPVEIVYLQDLPPIAPPGDYDVTLKARDGTNQELLCVTVHFTMVPPPSAAAAMSDGTLVADEASTAGRVANSRKLLSL